MYEKIPIFGWEATLIWSKESSPSWRKENDKLHSVEGEIHLLPDWKNRKVNYSSRNKTLSLNAYFCCYKDKLLPMLLNLPSGTNLFITGDINDRFVGYNADYSYLKTTCWFDEIVIDKSDGKIAAESALLLTANTTEFTETADLRFATKCPRCSQHTEEVAHTGLRFCPSCDQ